MLSVEKLDSLTPEIIDFLSDVLGGYDDYFVEEINSHVSELWKVNGGESYSITRLEFDHCKNKTVLVVCVYKGKNIEQFCDHVLKIVDVNTWSIRFHTEKIAFAKWMGSKYNFGRPELVLIRE